MRIPVLLFGVTALLILTVPVSSSLAFADDRNTCVNETGDEAIAACTRAITSEKYEAADAAVLYASRAGGWRQKKEYERSIADESEAIRLDPRNGAWFNSRCWTRAVSGGNLSSALADCNEALRLKYFAAYGVRGYVNFKLGRFNDAIGDYDAILKTYPKSAFYLYSRGIAKLHKGDTSESARDITAAKTIESGIADRLAPIGIK